jgi:hypothetical protein
MASRRSDGIVTDQYFVTRLDIVVLLIEGDCRIFGMDGHPAGGLSVNESTSSLRESIDESLRAR